MGLFDGTAFERPVLCERCGQDIKLCKCSALADAEVEPARQSLKLRVEKRKRGKVVTVISGLTGSPHQRRSLLTTLKNHCGAGGTQQADWIEIQGDHAARLSQQLHALGYRLF